MGKALEKNCGPVSYLGPVSAWQEFAGKAVNKLSLSLLRRRYDHAHGIALARRYGRIFTSRLSQQTADIVFAPAASTELAFLETNLPVMYLSDLTASQAVGYYDWYSHLLAVSQRNIFFLEKRAAGKASALVYPTLWAAKSAMETLPVDKQRVHVAPFGANIEDIPSASRILGKKKSDRCRLLFLGVDWKRKGGAIACQALIKLLEMGVDAELTVCGCTPPRAYAHERMRVIPFLDKNDARQRTMFIDLLLNSDFLILPTRVEAFGIVFSEAAAFGLPSITTETGGIPDIVRNGVNGYTLPLDADGTAYAEIIRRIYQDDRAYYAMVGSSRAAYDERLNWDAWALAVKKLFAALSPAGERSSGAGRSGPIQSGPR